MSLFCGLKYFVNASCAFSSKNQLSYIAYPEVCFSVICTHVCLILKYAIDVLHGVVILCTVVRAQRHYILDIL